MRLHDFILTNREEILVEWEAFARTCKPASLTMNVEALRDHANEMLGVIAADLRTAQSPDAQSEKSKGRAPAPDSALNTAAEEHGAGRAVSGFSVEQMVAEYRALRASVLRLWSKSQGEMKHEDLEELTRFNEAIDQLLAESITEFNMNVEQAKETFLAILGHDLRTPLGAIYTSAKFMVEMKELEEPHRTLIARIARSAGRTIHMVGDLLDFTRSRLGGGIPLEKGETDLGKLLHEVADEISAAHPGRKIEIDTREHAPSQWDAARLSQAFSNLLSNAVQHGSPESPVRVDLQSGVEEVIVTVHNQGPAIPAAALDGLFNPMKVSTDPRKPSPGGPTGSLGLGLYIAERIIDAHQGRIEVESSKERGTTFTVHLPRQG